MEIAGLIPNSTVDFPKVLAAVVFTRGCNMNCFYCHNRKLLNPCAPLIPNEEVFGFLYKRQNLIDCLVITGGEPTLQEDLKSFIAEVKALNYKIKLDTNGSKPEVVQDLLESNLLDYVAVDYKAPWARYEEICAYSEVENIKKTFRILQESGIAWEARTTVIPHITPQEYLNMCKDVEQFPRYVMNKYRIPEDFLLKDKLRLNMPPYSLDELKNIRLLVKEAQKNICLDN